MTYGKNSKSLDELVTTVVSPLGLFVPARRLPNWHNAYISKTLNSKYALIQIITNLDMLTPLQRLMTTATRLRLTLAQAGDKTPVVAMIVCKHVSNTMLDIAHGLGVRVFTYNADVLLEQKPPFDLEFNLATENQEALNSIRRDASQKSHKLFMVRALMFEDEAETENL